MCFSFHIPLSCRSVFTQNHTPPPLIWKYFLTILYDTLSNNFLYPWVFYKEKKNLPIMITVHQLYCRLLLAMARQLGDDGAYCALRRHPVHVTRAVQEDPQGGGPAHAQSMYIMCTYSTLLVGNMPIKLKYLNRQRSRLKYTLVFQGSGL